MSADKGTERQFNRLWTRWPFADIHKLLSPALMCTLTHSQERGDSGIWLRHARAEIVIKFLEFR